MKRLCYCRLMSDPDILVFSANEEANWWTPSAFSRREGEALRNYDKNLDPAIAIQLTRLSLDGGFDSYLDWYNGAPGLMTSPEKTCAGMSAGGEQVKQAILNKELIAVFCDYDVDGTSAGAVLSKGLSCYDPNLMFAYADAKDGFGLSSDFIISAAEQGASLLITLDCGSGQSEEIQQAKDLGLATIVVDHHQLAADNPCDVHLNPLLFSPPQSAHTGAQLAWKLVAAVQIAIDGKTSESLWGEPLFLAGLGCLADMGSVALPENRVFLRASKVPVGVEVLSAALSENPKVPGGLVLTQACLNLPKRTSLIKAETSGSLLASKTREEAEPLARQLLDVYEQGRARRSLMVEEALPQPLDSELFAVAILGDDHSDWVGYSGPVASALSSACGRPAMVFVPRGQDQDGNNVYKFSSRGSGQPIGQLITNEQMRTACIVDGRPSLGGHEAVVSGACLEENIELVREAAQSWASENPQSFQQKPWDGPLAFPFERMVDPDRFETIERQALQLAPFARGKQLVRIAAPNRTEERVTHRLSEISLRGEVTLTEGVEAPLNWKAAQIVFDNNLTRPVCVPADLVLPSGQREWIIKLGREAPYFVRVYHNL